MMASPARPGVAVACAVLLLVAGGGNGGSALRAQSTGAPPAGAQTPQTPIFRGGTNLVTVDVYPLRAGRVVEGLTADDFEVFEDGKAQKVSGFEFIRIEPTPTDTHRDPNTITEARQLAADPHNRVFIAFLDTHHVRLAGGYYVNKPLVDTLDRILAPNDLFGVMTPAMRPSDITFGRKTDTIEGELSKYWSWGRRGSMKIIPEGPLREYCYPPTQASGPLADAADPTPVRPVPLEFVERSWEEQALDSLELLADYLGRLRQARSDVLLLSDGWRLYQPDQSLANSLSTSDAPNASHVPGILVGPGGRLTLPGGPGTTAGAESPETCREELVRLALIDDDAKMRDVVTTATRNNVTFYGISPDGLTVNDAMLGDPTGTQPPPGAETCGGNAACVGAMAATEDMNALASRSGTLQTLASNTNGLAVVNTNDLAGGLKKVVDEVSAYYLLGYYSTNTVMDGKYRRIEVRLKPPAAGPKSVKDVKLVARRGYLATAAVDTRTAAEPGHVAVENADAATAFGTLDRVRDDSTLDLAGVAQPGEIDVTAEVPGRAIESGRWLQGGTVAVTVRNAAGVTLPVAQAAIAAGMRGAMVRIPIPAGADGPWRASVSVHGPDGTLDDAVDLTKAPGPLLGGALLFRGTPSAHSMLIPVADRQFRRTERVHVEWPILTALDARQARLLGRDGQPLPIAVNLTERDESGHATLAADLVLGPLAPSDYLIDLSVGAGTRTERQFVAFRLIP